MNENFIGKKIAELRKSRKLTQKELADVLFVTNKTVSRWELGQSEPEIDMLLRLSEIFEVDLNELIGNEAPVLLREKTVPQIAETPKKFGAGKTALCVAGVFTVVAAIIAALCAVLLPKGGEWVVTNKFEAEWAQIRAVDQSMDWEGFVESTPYASNGHCIAVFGVKNNELTFNINSSKATEAVLYVAVVSKLENGDEGNPLFGIGTRFVPTDFDEVWNIYVNPTPNELKNRKFLRVNKEYVSTDLSKLWYDFVEVSVKINLIEGENVIKFLVPETGSGMYGLNMDYIRIETDAELKWQPHDGNAVRPPDEPIIKDEEIHD